MKTEDIDALVTILNQAIEKRIAAFKAEFLAEQVPGLVKAIQDTATDQTMRLAEIIDTRLDKAIADLPKPENGKDGQSVTQEQVNEAVAKYLTETPVKGEKGDDGQSVTQEQIEAAVDAHLKENPVKGEKGEDGQGVTQEQVDEAVTKYLEANPIQHGKDATPEQVEAAVDAYLKANPVEIEVDLVEEQVSKWLDQNPPEVKQEHIADHVAKFLDTNPPKPGKNGQDGKDGERGLDALQIEILSKIDTEKRYPRGTYARYKGGIVRAMRDTDPGEPMQSGWEIMVNGLDDVQIHQLQGGEFAIKTILTSGQSNIVKAHVPSMEYKGVWKESHGQYAKGHTVTQNGSLWVCLKATTDKPGSSDSWQLAVKKGADGKDVNVVKLEKPEVYKL